MAHSLAILTDAAHLLTDFASIMISLFALWVSSRPPTKTMNFGWHRAGNGVAPPPGAAIRLPGSPGSAWSIPGCPLHGDRVPWGTLGGMGSPGKTPAPQARVEAPRNGDGCRVPTPSPGAAGGWEGAQARCGGEAAMWGWGGLSTEILGALLSVLSIWVVTGVLVYLAAQRLLSADYDIEGGVMLITSACAVAVNVVYVWLALALPGRPPPRAWWPRGCHRCPACRMGVALHQTGHGHSHEAAGEQPNASVRAAFVHVVGDLLQSVGVLIASYIIFFKVWVVMGAKGMLGTWGQRLQPALARHRGEMERTVYPSRWCRRGFGVE